MYCKNCLYSLKEAIENACPECGTAFDPVRPYTWYDRPRRPLHMWCWRHRKKLLAALLIPLVLYVGSYVYVRMATDHIEASYTSTQERMLMQKNYRQHANNPNQALADSFESFDGWDVRPWSYGNVHVNFVVQNLHQTHEIDRQYAIWHARHQRAKKVYDLYKPLAEIEESYRNLFVRPDEEEL